MYMYVHKCVVREQDAHPQRLPPTNPKTKPKQGWRRFWLSNLDVGNGGILQRPAPDYEALSAEAKEKRRREQQQGEGQGAQED